MVKPQGPDVPGGVVTAFSELLRKAASGDRGAVEGLWKRYEPRVRRVIARRKNGGAPAGCDTDDLTQSVFAEMMRDLPRFEDRGEPAFRRWLDLKAENKVYGKFRRASTGARVRSEAARLAPDRTPEGELELRAELDETRDAIQVAVDRLDPDARAVLRLRYDQDMGYVEIAHCLGLPSAEAARKRHARALLALRDVLRGDGVQGGAADPSTPEAPTDMAPTP
jgi:RNA polymerase sigma-70 factor (ECF subfamily)